MSTVVEIEKAIEEQPSKGVQKMFSWVEEKQAMVESTASVFAIYDEEEGEGTRWQRVVLGRGEMWIADLRRMQKARPVLVLSIA